MSDRFDLTVIGGGPGGYTAAIRAAQLGLRVALVEERELGGTCLNRGCIPTKSLLHSAEVYQTVKSSGEFGISAGNIGFDYTKTASRKDQVVKQLRAGIEALVKSNGITLLCGRASIKDKNLMEVTGRDGQAFSTGKLIIATGSRPSRPPIPGIDGSKVFDSDGVLGWDMCPERVVIIGGGVIGVEFATIFNSFGKDVTMIEMADSLLPGMDSELSQLLRKSLEEKGVHIYTSAKVTAIESGKNASCTFEVSGKTLHAEGDSVIVAVGRKPNTEDIGLRNIGLEMEKGFIRVNEKMETSIRGIYAIGDVTGKSMLAHVASAQGLVAATNAAGKDLKMEDAIIPGCVYTSPEIATVGLSEAEALKRGYNIKTGRFPIQANGKSVVMGEKTGFIKIIAEQATGEILGAHILGPRATDIISEICVAMRLESTFEEVVQTIHPHPTVSEIVMEAAHDISGFCVHKPGRQNQR